MVSDEEKWEETWRLDREFLIREATGWNPYEVNLYFREHGLGYPSDPDIEIDPKALYFFYLIRTKQHGVLGANCEHYITELMRDPECDNRYLSPGSCSLIPPMPPGYNPNKPESELVRPCMMILNGQIPDSTACSVPQTGDDGENNLTDEQSAFIRFGII